MNDSGNDKQPTNWPDAFVQVACLVFVGWLLWFFFH